MTYRIIPAILSGGAGARLWPLSTDTLPKQFHALAGEQSLFAQTLERVSGEPGKLSFAAPIILSNARHADLVRQHLGFVEAAAIVLEPELRNTAAAAAVAAAVAAEIEPGALLLLTPADHVIADVAAFHAALERAAPFARERIVTFGMKPNRPATAYGYIRAGEQVGDGVHAVADFREKPNATTAQTYLDAPDSYFWNSGMFLAAPELLLREFDASPAVRDNALEALAKAARYGVEIRLDPDAFEKIPSQPFDIAVMEKTRHGAVAPCSIGWADVGAWDEVWRGAAHDEAGNALMGPVAAMDVKNSLLRAEHVKLCAIGVEDLVIIATPEAVIVAPRERAQDVKALRDLADKL